MVHDIEQKLFCELVHCVEEYPNRAWERLKELGRVRDSLYGSFVPMTMWHMWLPRLERLLERLVNGAQLSCYEEELWDALLEYVPANVPDTEADEVVHPVFVQDRLGAFRARYAPADDYGEEAA